MIIFITIIVFIASLAQQVAGDSCLRHNDTSCNAIATHDEWIRQESDECFRAAVYESNRNDTAYYGQRVEDNLNLYAKVAKVAANNQAKVLVFPEDGLGDFPSKSYEDIEEIPDPNTLTRGNNNPCVRPELFGDNKILIRLSCIARENGLYVVANYGTRQSCDAGQKVGEQNCPHKGFFNLNTNVVLDPEGRFVKRYRKYNLFQEATLGVDHTPSLEEVYFDTPYGRFGVFTCFDMVFKWPAINLVEKHHIDTVLFPTWWHDEAPIFSGPLAQDGWSRSNRVNLLAANLLKPEGGAVGSGIYSGDSSVFTTAESRTGKLLIANVASKPRSAKCTQAFDPVVVQIDSGYSVEQYNYNNYELQASDKVVTLPNSELTDTFCSNQVCCTVDLKINGPVSGETLSKIIIIVRDDNRPGQYFRFYEQLCLVATLEEPFNGHNAVFAREPLVEFERLSLEATFESKYVMPMAGFSLTRPINRKDHQFECSQVADKDGLFRCTHIYLQTKSERVYSFGLYGRMYGRDKMPTGWTVASD